MNISVISLILIWKVSDNELLFNYIYKIYVVGEIDFFNFNVSEFCVVIFGFCFSIFYNIIVCFVLGDIEGMLGFF